MSPKLDARAVELGADDYRNAPCPWDLLGRQGHPIRTTVSEMGPLLLARLLDLNETQEGVLTVAFRVADDEGLLLLDLKDLRAVLAFLGENRGAVSRTYGNVATSSIGTIQRRLLVLEDQGAAHFFGEPALDLADLMRTTYDGRGFVNVLAADKLMARPRLYATFLLWLLAELFEELPEIGDPDKPVLVFFFDEAHLLFDGAPKALLEKVEQVVRLIRSKGGRRLLRHPKPDRRAARSVGPTRPARAARGFFFLFLPVSTQEAGISAEGRPRTKAKKRKKKARAAAHAQAFTRSPARLETRVRH